MATHARINEAIDRRAAVRALGHFMGSNRRGGGPFSLDVAGHWDATNREDGVARTAVVSFTSSVCVPGTRRGNARINQALDHKLVARTKSRTSDAKLAGASGSTNGLVASNGEGITNELSTRRGGVGAVRGEISAVELLIVRGGLHTDSRIAAVGTSATISPVRDHGALIIR